MAQDGPRWPQGCSKSSSGNGQGRRIPKTSVSHRRNASFLNPDSDRRGSR